MESKLPPLPVRIAVVTVLLGTLAYFGWRSYSGSNNSALTASGSIEATIVNVAPELPGRVSEVLADEGQAVRMNDPLLRLDPSLLAAQRAVAAAAADSANAALAAAQTRYDQSLQAALSAQEQLHAKDWRVAAPSEFNQTAWYFNQSEQLVAAQAEVDAAKTALDASFANLDKVSHDLNNANYIAAEQRLANARASFTVANDVKVQADNAVEGGGLQDAAYAYYNNALDELNAAQRSYNGLLNSQSRSDVQYARGQVVVAQQRYDSAYAELLTLQSGAQSPSVATASKALDQAKGALAQAQASLDLIDQQISKMTVLAPMDGVVLTRNVEPGEYVQPGAAALTVADLSRLTITVYIPENLYGNITLGQSAKVRVDSFADTTFTAKVIFIADQAEYTPRNVQTVEGRSATMIAVKLSVQDSDGKLKPGMPADVSFGS